MHVRPLGCETCGYRPCACDLVETLEIIRDVLGRVAEGKMDPLTERKAKSVATGLRQRAIDALAGDLH